MHRRKHENATNQPKCLARCMEHGGRVLHAQNSRMHHKAKMSEKDAQQGHVHVRAMFNATPCPRACYVQRNAMFSVCLQVHAGNLNSWHGVTALCDDLFDPWSDVGVLLESYHSIHFWELPRQFLCVSLRHASRHHNALGVGLLELNCLKNRLDPQQECQLP